MGEGAWWPPPAPGIAPAPRGDGDAGVRKRKKDFEGKGRRQGQGQGEGMAFCASRKYISGCFLPCGGIVIRSCFIDGDCKVVTTTTVEYSVCSYRSLDLHLRLHPIQFLHLKEKEQKKTT